MELLERTAPLPLVAAHPGITVLALHGQLSRVTRSDGAVLGYVELIASVSSVGLIASVSSVEERPYLAKRLRPHAQGFLEVGRFWSADEAVDALRY